jgi:hypothetical protein
MDSQASEINARLAKLERENRRMKKVGIVAIVFASVLFISGQAKTNKIVEANEFRLLDASGKERATLDVFRGQPELFIRSLNGQSDVLLGTDPSGPFLIMGPLTGQATVTLKPDNLSLEGPAGKLRIALNHEAGGPNLTIEDNEGYSTVLGRSDLVLTKIGKKEQTPAASLVLFDKGRKLLWAVPWSPSGIRLLWPTAWSSLSSGGSWMNLLTALQKEAQKLTKVKADVERQLNAIGAAVKAFGSTLAAESANGRRKKRGGKKGHKMSAAGRKAIAEAQRLRWAKQKKEKAKAEKS